MEANTGMGIGQFTDALMHGCKITQGRYLRTLGDAILDNERNVYKPNIFGGSVRQRHQGKLGEYCFDEWMKENRIHPEWSSYRAEDEARDMPVDVIANGVNIDIKTGTFKWNEYNIIYHSNFGLQVSLKQADAGICDAYVYAALDYSKWPWRIAIIGYATIDEVLDAQVKNYNTESYQVPIRNLHSMESIITRVRPSRSIEDILSGVA